MTNWKKETYNAIALFSYESLESNHLTLFYGDNLLVLESIDDWVFARSLTTNCVGICPKNRIKQIYETESEGSIKLLTLEAKSLLNHVFHGYFRNSPNIDSSDSKIFDCIKKIVENWPPNFETVSLISKNLDEIRSYLKFPFVVRSKNYNIMNTHDLSINTFSTSNQISETSGSESKNISTISIELTLKVNMNKTARICPRFYTISNGKTILTAPADLFHSGSNDQETEHILKFHNLESSILSNLALEIRVFEYKQFGTTKPKKNATKPFATEYIGVSAEYLGEIKDPIISKENNIEIKVTRPPRELIKGGEVNFTATFFMTPKGTSPSKALDYILTSQDNRLQISSEVPQFGIKIVAIERNDEAVSCLTQNSILSYKNPPNGTPTFKANGLFIHLKQLKHNSALKRTRIIIKLLDIIKKEFEKSFERTLGMNDGSSFSTLVEKGSKEFHVDELIHINLDNINVKNCYLIFEVQRLSRSGGTVHTSSFTAVPISEPDGTIKVSKQGETTDFVLNKPSKEIMTADDYIPLIKKGIKYTGTGSTMLGVDIKLISTINSSYPGINYLLNWNTLYNKDKISEAISMIKSIKASDIKESQFYYPQILKQLSEILATSSNKDLEECAMSEFMNILQGIDSYASRSSKLITSFFNYYIEEMFNETNSYLANLSSKLLTYVTSSLPEPDKPPTDISKCNNVTRCIPYLLKTVTASFKLERLIKPQNNESKSDPTFKNELKEINSRLSGMVRGEQKTLIQALAFISRSYWMLCDIIGEVFPPEESYLLIKEFLESNLSNIKDFTSNQNRARLLIDLVQTNFLKFEITRSYIMPTFLECLKIGHLTRGFQVDVFPVIQGIFFHMMHNSKNFSIDIEPFTNYIEDLIYSPDIEEPLNIDKFSDHILKLINDNDNTSPKYLESEQYIIQMLKSKIEDKGFKLIPQNINLGSLISLNPKFLIILLYFLRPSYIKKMIFQRINKVSFIWKLLTIIKLLIETSIPSFIFFIIVPTYVKIISFIKDEELQFPISQINLIIKSISGFYKTFLSVYTEMNTHDKFYYSTIYPINLSPVAALLPDFLSMVPIENRFDPDVFVPLFHFYINTDDLFTRERIAKGLNLLLEADWVQNKSIFRSENATTMSLDKLSHDNNSFIDIIQLFDDSPKFFTSISPLPQEFEQFYRRTKQLASFMNDLNKYKELEIYEDERCYAIVKILDSFLESKDFGYFPLFANKLYEFHTRIMKNPVEAAETLILLASVLNWNDHEIIQSDANNKITRSQKKVECLETAIKLFKEANFYENALEIIPQLSNYYKNIAKDFSKLSNLTKFEASLYEELSKGERNELNKFYGARFYGNFEENYKNKIYVYRRDGYFKSTDMMRSLQDKFPRAQVSPKPPTEEQIQSNITFIHVFNMKSLISPKYSNTTLPSEYMIKSCVNIQDFQSEQPVRHKRGINEFGEWHRYVYHYKSDKPLQSFIRRSEIISISEMIDVIPIQCACLDTNGKTIELAQKSTYYYHCLFYNIKYNEHAVSQFTMLINGIVNAAVNGGTALLQDLFLSDSDFAKESENIKYSQDLRNSFLDQLKVINFALKVHNFVVQPQFIPLHMNCSQGFEKMIIQMETALGKINLNESPTFGELPNINLLKDEELE